jgi:hypothetical protein
MQIRVLSFISITLMLVNVAMGQVSHKKKLPSISYTNVISCFPELKNSNMEFEVDLAILKKTIDSKYPTMKSTMRYRKVIYDDYKSQTEDAHAENSGITKSSLKKRLTLSLTHLKKGLPEYKMSVETLSDNMTGEMVSIPKAHENNPSKELIKSYLINTKIEEDESFWVDTKPNKVELSYKMNNESLIELDLSHVSQKKQIKCERKKDRGVLCLCLKK